jgi:hypothetical protein
MGDEHAVELLIKDINTALQEDNVQTAKTCVNNSNIHPQAMMDFLAPRLFEPLPLYDEEEEKDLNATQALQIVGFLATLDPKYLTAASSAVATAATQLTTSPQPMRVSPELLTVLLTQLTMTGVVQVSTNATAALVACSRKLGPILLDPAIQGLVDIWKAQLDTASKNNKQHAASTIAVRCASAMIDLVLALQDTAMQCMVEHGATDLFLHMLQDASDPLVQLSVLDLLEVLAQKTTKVSSSLSEETCKWLQSPPVVEPILLLSGVSSSKDTIMSDDDPDDSSNDIDPLLGGSALRLLSALCSQKTSDRTLTLLPAFSKALHNFASQSNSEVDRLHLVHAISSFAGSSPDALKAVLDDPTTRDAWLSLQHVAQPKLKAATLLSIAMVLDPSLVDSSHDQTPAPAPPPSHISLEPSLAMTLYSQLGQANGADYNTTDWMLKLAASPIPELRLASYTLLSAMAQAGGMGGAQVLLSSVAFLDFLFQRSDESTQDGRVAKFQVVQAVFAQVQGLLSDEMVRKFETHLKQGPHYVQTMQWDVEVAE